MIFMLWRGFLGFVCAFVEKGGEDCYLGFGFGDVGRDFECVVVDDVVAQGEEVVFYLRCGGVGVFVHEAGAEVVAEVEQAAVYVYGEYFEVFFVVVLEVGFYRVGVGVYLVEVEE
jgi:hypothetical protein